MVVLIGVLLGSGSGFDLNEARDHLFQSWASFCDSGSLQSWTCYWCNATKVQNIALLSNTTTDVVGFVGVDTTRNEIVVSFRGSKTIENWINDFDFIFTQPYTDQSTIKVHSGFWDSYTSISSQLVPALKARISGCPHCKRIAFVGHSLGAAVTTLAFMDIVYRHKITQPTPVIYNFGQPRVGNAAWVSWVRSFGNATRLVQAADIVPHLPPVDFDYRHMATEVWILSDQSNAYKVCDASGEDPTCSDSLDIYSRADHLLYLGYNVRNGQPNGC
uniref:Fungal lipase-type domain-containing protein n=1 Tax=Arcella intermedia TaxID=1963864 RepID=A0A6B2LDZ5_9EUKA